MTLQMVKVETLTEEVDIHIVVKPNDWAILASDTVLEVRAHTGDATYYPMSSVVRWTVSPLKR